ncbi:MAG: enoyl-CoA hydratase-related protein [bacterium]|nr:enoyl-CoA hydratase [Gammaproteobacteria bacterium]
MSNDTGRAEPVLLEETVEGVRLLRLNRPAKKNALSNTVTREIVRAIEAASQDDAIRVIGITGAGDAFCAGADLSPRKAGDAKRESGSETVDLVVQLVTGIRVLCEKPVIAGVNGIAIGAGLALAMCCDIRMASSEARFHPGYARAGTSPDCGLTWTLTQALGHEGAMRFLLEQDMIDAKTAHTIGLVGEVVAAEEFSQAFLAYCTKIAEVAPLAARQTKHLVTQVGLPADLEALVRDELRYTGRGLASDDGKEAVRAIFEKRKPVFTGR